MLTWRGYRIEDSAFWFEKFGSIDLSGTQDSLWCELMEGIKLCFILLPENMFKVQGQAGFPLSQKCFY